MESSARLELRLTDKGILIPKMNASEGLAITSAKEELMVFRTKGLVGYFFSFAVWDTVINVSKGTNENNEPNSFTLGSGIYEIQANMPSVSLNENHIRLYSVILKQAETEGNTNKYLAPKCVLSLISILNSLRNTYIYNSALKKKHQNSKYFFCESVNFGKMYATSANSKTVVCLLFHHEKNSLTYHIKLHCSNL